MMSLSPVPSSFPIYMHTWQENTVILKDCGVKPSGGSESLTSASGWQAALGLATPNMQTCSFYLILYNQLRVALRGRH